jgi:hypothetical protein
MSAEPLLTESILVERVDRLGRRQTKAYPDALVEELRGAYSAAGKDGVVNLSAIAAKWGKNKANLCRAAKALGLPINPHRRTVEERKDRRKFKGNNEALSRHRSVVSKERIAKNGHPRGMLGKRHSEEVRAQLGESSRAWWGKLSDEQRAEHTLKGMKTRAEVPSTPVSRGSWKAGWRQIGGKRNYYRSRWEANYARWLELLKERGEIVDWEFEPHVFWFDKIKRGVRSYKPDFRVIGGTSTDAITWHEIKGWMDARSQTTLKRMAKYHPDEIIILVRESRMKQLLRGYAPAIPDWEYDARGRP